MSDIPEKCPKCGAGPSEERVGYECGGVWNVSSLKYYVVTRGCFERQRDLWRRRANVLDRLICDNRRTCELLAERFGTASRPLMSAKVLSASFEDLAGLESEES